MNTDDSATLYNIAYQCPYQGCEGVYIARGLLSMFGYFDYDDSVICNTDEYAYRTIKPKSNSFALANSNNVSVSIYPNPSKTVFNIALKGNVANTIYYAEVYDITGQLKNKVTLQSGITTIDCNDCGEGVFIVKIVATNGNLLGKPQRIVLMK